MAANTGVAGELLCLRISDIAIAIHHPSIQMFTLKNCAYAEFTVQRSYLKAQFLSQGVWGQARVSRAGDDRG